jgi:N-acetylglucosaminyl-diphospho-decaprenol L-rhamnosyltransferase
MKPPTFSVLTVGYNSSDDIGNLLESLRRLPSWADSEILLAENGTTEIPAMEQLASEFGARLVVLPNPGFGKACNTLAELAHGEIILLVNPDLRFDQDILPSLAKHLESPEVGAVGPILRDVDGSEQISWNLPMGLWWEFLEANGLQTWWRRRLMRKVCRTAPKGPWTVGFATAACLAVRKHLFQDIGGFDEGFFLNGEDIELCDRIRARDLSVLVDPSISAIHGNSSIQSRNLEKFVADRLEGKRKYLSRRYRGVRLFLARALWVEMVALRYFAGLLLLRGQQRTRLPGYRQILVDSLRLLLRI